MQDLQTVQYLGDRADDDESKGRVKDTRMMSPKPFTHTIRLLLMGLLAHFTFLADQ